MTIEKHDLIHDLPQYKDRIHQLKTSDAHFAKLFAEYHEVDHEIRRIEQELETPGDDYVENLKTRRVRLKDQLYTQLTAAG